MTTLYDAVTLSGTRKTADGYLVASAKVARTGIQEYRGYECDADGSLGLRDMAVVRVYRPEHEVFADAAMQSYAYRPVTNDHPSEAVSAENWRDLSVGQTGGDIARDGDWVKVPMVLMDAGMIRAVEGGKRQLSMGYTCTLDATPGTTPTGEKYDAVQTGLRMNHLAVVTAARAGADARIGDDKGAMPITPKEDLMSDTLKPVVLGDKAVQVAAADVAAIDAFKADMTKQLADAATALAKADAERDDAIAKRDAALASVPTGAAMDALVIARADLIGKASRIAPAVKTDGLTDADIRKAVVTAKIGDAATGKSDAYIDARFDMLCEDAAQVADVANAIQIRPVAVGDAAAYEAALAASNANLNKRFAAQ